MAKSFNNIGSMKTKKEKDANGNPQYYIEIDKNFVDRLKLDGKAIGKYINVDRPTSKFDRMLKSGKITEAEYDQKTADFAADGKLSFIKFDLQIVLEDK